MDPGGSGRCVSLPAMGGSADAQVVENSRGHVQASFLLSYLNMETRRSYRPPPAATSTAVGIGPVDLPAAAVVRKGRAREQQDLFAAVDDTAEIRGAMFEGVADSRTGERSENSVLFSASVFNAPSAPPPMRERADSSTGTIDLCALAKQNGSSLEYKPLSLSEPPMGAFVQDLAPPASSAVRANKHTGLFIAGGIAATFMLGIIGVATFAGGADEPTAPKQVAAARAAIADSAKIAIGRDEAPAPVAAVVAKSGKSSKSASGMGFASSGRTASSGTSSAPVTPKKPIVKSADPCHCKGVLSCVIRCSATGR